MSTLLIQKRILVNGTPKDADSIPVLSDQAAVYGVKRQDNNAIIVAAGTAMTHDGTGLYSYSVPSVVAGVTYLWVVKAIINGQIIYDPGSALIATDAWYYSDINGVKRLVGANNLAIESNLQDDTTVQDDATIVADGLATDVLINLRLRKEGFSHVPVVLADWDDDIVGGLALASDHLTAGYLANHRLLYDAKTGTQLDPDKVGFTARGYEILDEVIEAMRVADADVTDEIIPAMQAIVPMRDQSFCNGVLW